MRVRAAASPPGGGGGHYVHACGASLCKPGGGHLRLRGVNLGGWLVTENWLCGITDRSDAAAGRFTLETLEERFGAARAGALMDTWYDSFIVARDFDKIAALGFNVVRVPFGYRNLQDASRKWKGDAFKRLDWAVAQAKRVGLYVILDYHVWWGQEQARSDRTGAEGERVRAGAYDMINFGSGSAAMKAKQRAHAIELWRRVLRHYRGEAAIAAVQYLNEPNGGMRGSEFLFKALADEDPGRLVIAWGHPEPDGGEWGNVAFGPHIYDAKGRSTGADHAAIAREMAAIDGARRAMDVPFFVGEFHVFGDDKARSRAILAHLLREMNARDVSWTKWTWKGVDVGDWALVNVKRAARIDASEDTFEAIADAWAGMGTGEANDGLQAVLEAAT